jgi:hypothetical protein
MRRFFCLGFVLLGLVTRLSAHDMAPGVPADVRPLAGVWRYDEEHSTPLSAWGSLKLTITVDGPKVTITKEYAAGRRTFTQVTPLDMSKTINVVPVEWWPDNRHIGAYIGGDKTKKMKVRVLNDGRLLRTSSDYVLATQQGEQPVNVLCDYRVSPSGQQLTLIQLRSSRNDPIVYVFKRVTDQAADAKAGKGNAE